MSQAFTTLRALAAGFLLTAGAASMAAAEPAGPDAAAIASLQGAFARSVVPGDQAQLYLDLLATVMQRVKRSHATEVDLGAVTAAGMKVFDSLPPGAGDPIEVFKKAVHESLRTIDPHARYIDPRTLANERGEANGSFGGLGLEVQPAEGAVRVVAPIPGSPAARAGLEAGDLIVRVDDQPLVGIALPEAIARMRGQPGTPVSITVLRAGTGNMFTVSLTRDTIRRQVLRSSMEGDVLVLRLTVFTGSATSLLEQALAQALTEAKPRAVVLDLRGNPGGMLREAVRVADAFLGAGEIVSLRGNSPERHRAWQADSHEVAGGLPMVVLIDGRSASASELVADALQHNGRATVMGQRSFGKGSVQTTFSLGDNKGALKLTTALYHGPSGQTVHRIGVAPDIELLAAGRNEVARATPDGVQQRTKARVDPGRCAATLKEPDPALSCAVSYLLAGSVDAFVARLTAVAR